MLTKEQIETVLKVYNFTGGKRETARQLNMPESTVRNIIKKHKQGMQGGESSNLDDVPLSVPSIEQLLKDRVRTLEAQAAAFARETLDEHYVKSKVLSITSQIPNPPKWLTEVKDTDNWEAVPTLFFSDAHWGEVVDPSQIGGVNEFNLTIAHARMKSLIATTKQLLTITSGKYPGIVFACGGDLVSGDIHEELQATNEKELMPIFVDLYGVMIWAIKELADEYKNVFIPWVSGNHGRNTHKIRAKGRNFTNFDWLLGVMLQKYFENDSRIVFDIPNGSDAVYNIYGHRYLLTHGDQFRGGDSMIGCLGPITRGDHKKRSRNNQIDMGYDTMIIGHWHQLIQMQRLIVNGSLKGYDEYAYTNNFGYEPPRQALWLTHKEHGIIMSMPVNVGEDVKHNLDDGWVSWKQ